MTEVIRHFLKVALADSGYKTVQDVLQVLAADLCIELEIGIAQAEDILRQAEDPYSGPSQCPQPSQAVHEPTQPVGSNSTNSHFHSSTAAELLSTSSLSHFSTLSSSLDQLISHFGPDPEQSVNGSARAKGKSRLHEGSIVPGMTLELSGPPGGGKTAIALGIALSARFGKRRGVHISGDAEDVVHDEEPGEVLIIDSEGAMTPGRVFKAAVSLTRNISVSPRFLINGIHLVRIATQVQMIAFINTMEEWLDEHPKVNLVVFDTLSFHFRQPTLDMKTRTRIMELVKQKIGIATTVHHCGVIVMNQLATKLLTADHKPANFDTGDRAVLMPQLGDSWTTARTIRIVLFRGGPGDELRYAHASTSSGGHRDVPWAKFDIDGDGLPCGVPGLAGRLNEHEA